MKIEIKENSKEKELIERAVALFGYKNPTQFILAAISGQYRIDVNRQLEIAAEAKNREMKENPEYMNEMHRIQGVSNG